MKLEKPIQNALNQLPEIVEKQALAQYEKILSGVSRYQQAYKPRILPDMPTIWQKGSARLLDYGVLCTTPPTATVLLIPSLINRYYILDLSEKQSMARYLASQGIYPLVMDWGEPTSAEYSYDMAGYVENILLPAIRFCAGTSAAPLHLAGYCLGGVLALAATQISNAEIKSLALLATPWDFSASDVNIPRMQEVWLHQAKQQIISQTLVSAKLLQLLFMLRHPFAFEQKFARFAECENTRVAEEFMQLEQWVNDGVAMTSPAAADTLIHWIQQNKLANMAWHVAGVPIHPSRIQTPCFASVPKQDVIVPYGCAKALVKHLAHVEAHSPNAGHVGMIVGSRAKKQLWEPYAAFVLSL